MPELAENAQAPAQGPAHKHKRRRNMLIFCVVSLINVGLVALILTQLLTPASHGTADPLVGHAAPDFSLAMLRPQSGESRISLANFKGRAVVLNFWASWCAPCKEEVPLLESAWRQMQAQGKNVVFLGIDFQEPENDATHFMQLYTITYPTALDADGSAATKYGITSLPLTI
jgi:cytochrome c biogenesis protein CcmG, thiol:disulfide interchange protein DsbE